MTKKLVFELAPKGTLAYVLEFYREFWNGDHVYFHSSSYAEWVHGGAGQKKHVGFFYGKCEETGSIQVCVGLIDSYDFSGVSDPKQCPIWLILLKSGDGAPLGSTFLLLKSLMEHFPSRPIGTIGATADMQKTYKAFGFHCGELHHYGWRNSASGVDPLPVTDIPNECLVSNDLPDVEELFYTVERPGELDGLGADQVGGYKDGTYLSRWYADHPFKSYQYITDRAWKPDICVVFRLVKIESITHMRILDIVGNQEQGLKMARSYSKANNVACFDAYLCSSNISLEHLGVIRVCEPCFFSHYLAPLVRKEIPIRYAISSHLLSFSRGDCDQDRPAVSDVT